MFLKLRKEADEKLRNCFVEINKLSVVEGKAWLRHYQKELDGLDLCLELKSEFMVLDKSFKDSKGLSPDKAASKLRSTVDEMKAVIKGLNALPRT